MHCALINSGGPTPHHCHDTHLEEVDTCCCDESGVCLCVAAIEGDGRLGGVLLQLVKGTCGAKVEGVMGGG
jgi:hypothetical protein